jgi:hypothetical protein
MDFPERLLDDKRENSIEDNYFLEQVNESVSFENGHYYIALPLLHLDEVILKVHRLSVCELMKLAYYPLCI